MDRKTWIIKISINFAFLVLATTTGQRALGQSVAQGAKKCIHSGKRVEIPSGSVGENWVSPRNGPQLFHNSFHNQTSVIQTYSQEVRGEVTSSFDGSLTLSAACARVGASVVVSLSRVYPVNVPPRSSVTMTAYANMMSRSIEMMSTCNACHEVLNVKSNWVTSARGINEYFSK